MVKAKEVIRVNMNYPSHRGQRSADVLKVGNGLVVFRVINTQDDTAMNIDDNVTKIIKVVTETNFRRAYAVSGITSAMLFGPKIQKRSILKLNAEAEQAWT